MGQLPKANVGWGLYSCVSRVTAPWVQMAGPHSLFWIAKKKNCNLYLLFGSPAVVKMEVVRCAQSTTANSHWCLGNFKWWQATVCELSIVTFLSVPRVIHRLNYKIESKNLKEHVPLLFWLHLNFSSCVSLDKELNFMFFPDNGNNIIKCHWNGRLKIYANHLEQSAW